MPTIKSFGTTLLFISACLLSSASSASDTMAAREAAATRYLRAVPTAKILEDYASLFTQKLPLSPEQKKQITQHVLSKLDIARLEKVSKTAMVRTFTASELNALTDFYSSKDGASAMRKFNYYTLLILPEIESQLEQVLHDTAELEKILRGTN